MALYAYRKGQPLYVDHFFNDGIDKFVYKNVTFVSMTHISDLRLIVAKVMVLELIKKIISDYCKVNAVIWNGSHIYAEGRDCILDTYDVKAIKSRIIYFIQSDDFTCVLNSAIESTMSDIHVMTKGL